MLMMMIFTGGRYWAVIVCLALDALLYGIISVNFLKLRMKKLLLIFAFQIKDWTVEVWNNRLNVAQPELVEPSLVQDSR